MSKTMKQHTLLHHSRHQKGSVVPGKFIGRETYGFPVAPLNPRVKELLSKANQTLPTRYMIVQINQELAREAEQKKPVAKAEAGRAMFARYRASK